MKSEFEVPLIVCHYGPGQHRAAKLVLPYKILIQSNVIYYKKNSKHLNAFTQFYIRKVAKNITFTYFTKI